jgi:anti-sigma regulatory factor (Ser/Thr protein kinase)
VTQVTRSRLAAAGLTRPGDVVATLRLDPVPPSAGLARRFVGEALRACEDPDRSVAVLVTSELVTNAVVHARTMVEVDVVRRPDAVVIAVTDGAPTPLARSQATRGDENGRGLTVVDSLVDDIGTIHYPDGKTVWVVIGIAS